MEEVTDPHVTLDEDLRRAINSIIQRLKWASGEGSDPWLKSRKSRERSRASTKLQEAVMWLWMDIEAINGESGVETASPYPNSKDPKIDPAAEGLKL